MTVSEGHGICFILATGLIMVVAVVAVGSVILNWAVYSDKTLVQEFGEAFRFLRGLLRRLW